MPKKKAEDLGIEKMCQNCGKRKEDTRSREIYLKVYMGPCGDSFCYAGCDSPTCRPIQAAVCDVCNRRLAKK